MPLQRGYAFKGKKEYADRLKQMAVSRQKSARHAARVSYRQIGFPIPVPSTAPAGSLETKSAQFTPVSLTPAASPTTISHVNVIAQGAGNNNRIGNKYRLTGVSIKGLAAANDGDKKRSVLGYYLVWDKQTNKALPTGSDIFTIDAANNLYTYNTGLRVGSRERFQIVGSYRTMVGGQDDNLPSLRDINMFHKLPKSCVSVSQVGNTSGAITSIVSGSLLLIPFGSRATDVQTMQVAWQVFFEEA